MTENSEGMAQVKEVVTAVLVGQNTAPRDSGDRKATHVSRFRQHVQRYDHPRVNGPVAVENNYLSCSR